LNNENKIKTIQEMLNKANLATNLSREEFDTGFYEESLTALNNGMWDLFQIINKIADVAFS
jgi:hypothetical protein